mmetsp:Transcript_23373/g.79183  ORF Transcript_23373/g.79183 Transcript_23373/m.79183 type:complete len:205 (+) Transcript_23373:1978-2592(+)
MGPKKPPLTVFESSKRAAFLSAASATAAESPESSSRTGTITTFIPGLESASIIPLLSSSKLWRWKPRSTIWFDMAFSMSWAISRSFSLSNTKRSPVWRSSGGSPLSHKVRWIKPRSRSIRFGCSMRFDSRSTNTSATRPRRRVSTLRTASPKESGSPFACPIIETCPSKMPAEIGPRPFKGTVASAEINVSAQNISRQCRRKVR